MTDPLPTFGPWTSVEKLGEGGMCAVYRVKHSDRRRPERAVKVLTDRSDNAVDRFAAEAKLLMKIDHPNILKVKDLTIDEDGHRPWIVMELLAGRDLEELMVEEPLAPERVANMFAEVADGLAEVHRQGVRHRDIKPANIMLGHDGVPRLIDFGIAREVQSARRTQAGFLVGTASYLPPEVFKTSDAQEAQDNEVADVYALGQSMYEVLSGQPLHPAAESDGPKVLIDIMKDKVQRLYLDPREHRPEIPPGLAEIVIEATAQDPDDRIRTATDLEKKLHDWLKSRRNWNAAPVSGKFDPSKLPPPPTSGDIKLPDLSDVTEPAKPSNGLVYAGVGLMVALFLVFGLVIVAGLVLFVLYAA